MFKRTIEMYIFSHTFHIFVPFPAAEIARRDGGHICYSPQSLISKKTLWI